MFVVFVRSHTSSDVALLVDNISSHLGLKVQLGVQIISLPPNATAVHHLIDMGFIRAWKSSYRRLMLREILKEIECRIERRDASRNRTKGLHGLCER